MDPSHKSRNSEDMEEENISKGQVDEIEQVDVGGKMAAANDDFGDFNEDTQDDGFGDFAKDTHDDGFGDFDSVPVAVLAPTILSFDTPLPDLKEEATISQFVIYNLIPRSSSSLLCGNLDNERLVQISPEFAQEPWAKLLKRLQTETIYTHPDSFRWRKSKIRTAFLDSITGTAFKEIKARSNDFLKSDIYLRGKDVANITVATESNNASIDSREEELITAKKLCDITEDDLRRKSKSEIQELIEIISTSLSKISDQTNYWLDSREQLVMESEMHNKMIASLVSYAQQKQAPKKKK